MNSDTVMGCSRGLRAAICGALDMCVFEEFWCATSFNVSEVVVKSDNQDVTHVLSSTGQRESSPVTDTMTRLFPLNSFEPHIFSYPPNKVIVFCMMIVARLACFAVVIVVSVISCVAFVQAIVGLCKKQSPAFFAFVFSGSYQWV
ncbi:hypothetical protein V6N11_028384 [Hibiscus sabdariffa]|uniref:RNase H type-1 domain-containing protein n=1 Tax=Hibiscus sabdariffa TaxID=183260 RepID=A0ABR2NQD9_9ROSI